MTGRLGFSIVFAAVLMAACSDFFGEGADPSRAGPFHTGGTSSTSGGSSNVGGGSCMDDLTPWVLFEFDCPDVVECTWQRCASALSCLGANIRARDFNGSQCPSWMSCLDSCRCDSICPQTCPPDSNPSCGDCNRAINECLHTQCPAQVQACQSGQDGGTGKFPEVLATNLNSSVNDIAVDETHVYFSTQQGIAKVAKAGGTPTPLGGFGRIMGIALSADFIYMAQDSGALTRVSKDGSEVDVIVEPTIGGGSGSIAIDVDSIFYTVGPYLRRAPIEGGTATDLNDEFGRQGQGGPDLPRELALGPNHVYYVGHAPLGPGPASDLGIRMLEKTTSPGTGAVIASGDVKALVTDKAKIYFTQVASNGISSTLQVNALTPTNMEVTELTMQTASQDFGGGFGGALVLDGTHLIFGGSPGLFSISLTDQSIETLSTYAMMPGVLAVDDQYVYYYDVYMGGSLWRLEKTAN